MNIKKLNSWQEWLEAEKISATAFLFKFEEEKSKEKYKNQFEGKAPRYEDAWGAFRDDGKMMSSLVTYKHRIVLDGSVLQSGEINMVSSLPEQRGSGNVRGLFREVLLDLKKSGCSAATLHPFSFSFYRKFGFELSVSALHEEIPVEELSGFKCKYSVKRAESQEDIDLMSEIYQRYIMNKNLGVLREKKDWKYRGGGEYGEEHPFQGTDEKYCYIFSDESGKPRGYICFTYAPSKAFITGTMRVHDMAYDSRDTLYNILGFVYGMRAKIENLSLSLSEGFDMSVIVPNGNKVTRKLESFSMLRILDIKKVLETIKYPEGSGKYSLKIYDKFMPENSGVYSVEYKDGKAQNVSLGAEEYDMYLSEETFCQLATGLIDIDGVKFKPEAEILSNEETLRKVFIKKVIFAD